jgi:uncharacterized membrane protein YoaK (UPF0700 family)
MSRSRRRLAWAVLVAVAGCAALAVLDRTSYASWAERLTLALLFAAAIVVVLRNVRDG